MISQPNRWRAEWVASPSLQEQFPSADSYAEHQATIARGEQPAARPAPRAASTVQQGASGSSEASANYAAGVASGRIRVAGGRTSGATVARSMLSGRARV
jgi:hypothetical protein